MSLIRALAGMAAPPAVGPPLFTFGFVFKAVAPTLDPEDVWIDDSAPTYANKATYTNNQGSVDAGIAVVSSFFDWDYSGTGNDRYDGYAFTQAQPGAELGWRVDLPAGDYQVAVAVTDWETASCDLEFYVDGNVTPVITQPLTPTGNDAYRFHANGVRYGPDDAAGWLAAEPSSRANISGVTNDIEVRLTTHRAVIASIRFYQTA